MSAAVPFRRVLVMGAVQTGKTTLLSKGICGDFDEYYTATHHGQTFYDCKRRLELIDTPGVADAVLTPDFAAFCQDVLVSKMLSNSLTADVPDKADRDGFDRKADLSVTDREIAEEEQRRIEEKNRANPLAGADGLEINTKLVDVYVIVYTPEPRSKYIARCLKRAIRENGQATLRSNPIVFVLNECQHDRPPHPQPKEVKKWEEVALRTAKGPGGSSSAAGGLGAQNAEDRAKIDEWKAMYGAANVRIMTRIFSGDDGMDTRTEQELNAGASADANDYREYKYTIRADTGAGLHQLLDQLANCPLPAPPKRYAMGSGETVKKAEKRENCSIDSCTLM